MQSLYNRYNDMLPRLRERYVFTFRDYRRNENTPLAVEALRRFSVARRDYFSAKRIVDNIRRDNRRRSESSYVLSRRLPLDVVRYIQRF